ncbi:hypothetical protein AAZX31_14G204800 [Glycine max]
MSRCFPFPPPGYRARGEALIKSIKLREEMEKAEKDRREKKEKKREKKERKREKKEKKERRKAEKERKLKDGASACPGTDDGKKFKLINELKETKADGKLQKGEDSENEQHERSGITEELDLPVTSVEPCLSDCTQSSKRKRSSPESTHDHGEEGSAIKIRLPLRKHREPEELKSKSKFQAGCSSGSVGETANSFTKTTLGSDRQSQCLRITELNRVLGNSDSRHGKAMQNSVHGDVVVTKNTIGSNRQSQCHRTTEPKHVIGNSGKVMQNSVHGDAAVIKNTIGSDRQSQCLRTTEPKRVLGNSGKVMQNSVHGDAAVIKNSIGSDCQSQCLGTTVPKRVLGNSVKAMQAVHGDAVVTKKNLGSDQYLRVTEPKRVLGNSDSRNGKAKQNPVHGDAVVTKNTFGSDHQLKSLEITEPKRILGNSDSKHCKALQNLVPGSQKVESLYESLLQIPPLTYDGLDSVYDDWLFSSEPKESRPVSKKQKCDSDVFQLSNSMWPRAQYLPEVEVYALPYAVPF